MFSSPRRLPVSWLCIGIALAGAAYCATQALPPQAPFSMGVPCSSAGCALFQDFTVYGVSLWWAGVAYFLFAALLCFKKAHSFALFAATAALLADAVLLAIMLATAPCVACLGAAAFIGLFFLALRRHMTVRLIPPPGSFPLLLLWVGLFLAAGASAVAETARPWVIAGNPAAERRVYFSPSCPACRDAVAAFAGNAAFIPIVERESDYAAIRMMHEELLRGKTVVEALHSSDAAGERPLALDDIVFRLMLLRNKAEVLKLGFDRLPLIMINGMPESMRPQSAAPLSPQQAAPSSRPGAGAALPPELSPLLSCGENTPEPCETPR